MNPFQSLVALLVFPGLLYAVPMGWLMLGGERKLRARFQGRIGPPLTQPFWDTVKLLAKHPAARVPADLRIFLLLPLLAVGSALGALALLPVSAGESGFSGDLVLLVTLLEVPPLCLILAGYASRSIYGELGATREAVVSIAANAPFLAALVAMATAAGSLHISAIATHTPWVVRVPAIVAVLLCLPVKLRINPVSLANAEQEVLAGPLTEFDGRFLALWELTHALEWVALSGLVITLAAPFRSASGPINGALFIVASFALVPVLTLLASATARLKLAQATRLLWRWASAVAAIALVLSMIMRQGGQ